MEESNQTEKSPDDQIKRCLKTVHRLKSNFERTLNEVLDLSQSVHNANDAKQVTWLDYRTLEEEYQLLKERWRQYESSVDDFNERMESTDSIQDDNVNQGLDEAMETYHKTKIDVEQLLRVVRNQIRPIDKTIRQEAFSSDESISTTNNGGDDKNEVENEVENEPKREGTAKAHGKRNLNRSEESSIRKNAKRVLFGIIAILLVYFVFFLVISNTVKSRRLQYKADNKMDSDSPLGNNSERCGADTFMLRDLVCDELTNTAICLYDGGDCCLELKDTTLCKNCSCILEVEPEKLQQTFTDLDIKPLENIDDIESLVERWIVEVEDVVSGPVCAVLCLDHDKTDNVNVWQFSKQERLCRCGWIESNLCPAQLVNLDWTLDEMLALIHGAYLQMIKTIPCGIRTKAPAVDEPPMTYSALHCQKKCQNEDDCDLFSWHKPDQNSTVGECRLMESMESNKTMSTLSFLNGWVSSAKDCLSFKRYFRSYSNNDGSLKIVCPLNKETNGNTSISHAETDYYLVSVSAWLDSSHIEVLNFEGEEFRQCAHSLSLPKAIKDATGGVLTDDSGNVMIVICGGQDSNNDEPNEMCYSLSSSYKGVSVPLRSPIIDGASLVTDNGKRLWLTGGFDTHRILINSEYVKLQNQTTLLVDNMERKSMLYMKQKHCLARIGPNIAILTGGRSDILHWFSFYDFLTWSVNVTDMDWREQRNLIIPRSDHVCGALKDSNKIIVIVAGGERSDGLLTDSVELLVGENEEQFHDSNSTLHWELGPYLPEAISDSASSTSSDQTRFFVIGGTTNEDVNSGKTGLLYVMQCINLQCSWRKLDHELRIPSSHGHAFMLPSIQMERRIIESPCGMREHDVIIFSAGFGKEQVRISEAFTVDTDGLKPCHDSELNVPYRRSHPASGVLNLRPLGKSQTIPTPVICGGLNYNDMATKECFRLGHNQPLASMMTERFGPASVSIRNGTALWITGGRSVDNEFLDSTEWLNVSDNADNTSLTASEGVRMPYKLTFHCLVMIDNSLAIIYGGKNDQNYYDFSWTLDLDNPGLGWTQQASMAHARSEMGCGVIKDVSDPFGRKVLVAVAGEFPDKSKTNEVELLQVVNNVLGSEWEPGPKLPVSLEGAASTTTADQTLLLLAGGQLLSGFYSSSIFLFQCSGMLCEWKRQCQELRTFRRSLIAFTFPATANQNDQSKITNITMFDECKVGKDPLDEECINFWIGNDICNAVNNRELCFYDGGDCFAEQLCHQSTIGDDYCDSINNRAYCDFDGGDCSSITNCPGNHHFISDYVCDDDLNIPECDFDGGDCCLSEVATDVCKICECLE